MSEEERRGGLARPTSQERAFNSLGILFRGFAIVDEIDQKTKTRHLSDGEEENWSED